MVAYIGSSALWLRDRRLALLVDPAKLCAQRVQRRPSHSRLPQQHRCAGCADCVPEDGLRSGMAPPVPDPALLLFLLLLISPFSDRTLLPARAVLLLSACHRRFDVRGKGRGRFLPRRPPQLLVLLLLITPPSILLLRRRLSPFDVLIQPPPGFDQFAKVASALGEGTLALVVLKGTEKDYPKCTQKGLAEWGYEDTVSRGNESTIDQLGPIE